MTGTKLSYLVQCRPAPFLTGQSGTLQIVISNFSDDPVRVKAVYMSLSTGTGPSDLSEDLSKVKASMSGNWSIGSNDGSFTLTRKDGCLDVDPDGGDVLTIPKIKVNNVPGASEIFILEETEVDGKLVRETKRVPMVKVSPNAAIEYFEVVPSSFKPGDSVELKWKGTPNATYVLSYPDHVIEDVKDQAGTPLPNEGSYFIDDLDEDTTFTLTLTGGPRPLTQQANASIERAKVVNFTVDNPNPLYNQPVRLDWDVLAEEIEIIHDGKVLKKATCDGVGTIKGNVMVKPDKPDALYTLTAKAGDTTDQKTAQVAVQVPEVTIDVDSTALTYGKNPAITWGFKNRWDCSAELEAVGARTNKSYFKTTLKADDGKDASEVSTQITPFDLLGLTSTHFDLGVGEGLVLTAKAPWFDREEPVVATKTLTFAGVQDLRPNIGYPSITSYAGKISELANDIATNGFFISQGIVPEQLGLLAVSYGVAPNKIVGAERWSIPFIIYGDGIKSVSLRINAWNSDSEWKKLWFKGMNLDPIGGNSVSVAPWYNTNGTKYRGQLSLFAPKSMLDEALMALHFTVGGEGMHVSWNATGDKYLKVSVA